MNSKYRVVADGIDIFTNDDPLINVKLNLEVNSAGSLDFTMPKMHMFYDNVQILKTTIEVYEMYAEDEWRWIFTGRPITIDYDFKNNKKVRCEGAMAFFNDTLQPYHVYDDDVFIRDFFTALIHNHNWVDENEENARVEANRQIFKGNVTIAVGDRPVYRKTNFETTKDCLTTMCIDTTGGYMIVTKEAKSQEDDTQVLKLNWYNEITEMSNQPIQFGLNLTELTKTSDGENLYSIIQPYAEYEDNGTTYVITSDPIEIPGLVSLYGKITKKVAFEGVTDATTLATYAQAWVDSQEWAHEFTIECDAADLNGLDSDMYPYEPFTLGTKVHVTSSIHGINLYLPITKIEIDLSSASRSLSIGTPSKPSLTEIVKPTNELFVEW